MTDREIRYLDFCEEAIERPLFEHEKETLLYLMRNPDAKLYFHPAQPFLYLMARAFLEKEE